MDWEAIKEQARVVYARGSQVLIFLQVVFYLVACVVASKPVGPKQYVAFAYHVIQWVPNRTPVTPAAYLSHKAEDSDEPDKPHMNFTENH